MWISKFNSQASSWTHLFVSITKPLRRVRCCWWTLSHNVVNALARTYWSLPSKLVAINFSCEALVRKQFHSFSIDPSQTKESKDFLRPKKTAGTQLCSSFVSLSDKECSDGGCTAKIETMPLQFGIDSGYGDVDRSSSCDYTERLERRW